MAKKENRVIIDALNVTLNERETEMLETLQYTKSSKYFKKNRSALIRALIKDAYNNWSTTNAEENSK